MKALGAFVIGGIAATLLIVWLLPNNIDDFTPPIKDELEMTEDAAIDISASTELEIRDNVETDYISNIQGSQTIEDSLLEEQSDVEYYIDENGLEYYIDENGLKHYIIIVIDTPTLE